MTFPNAFSAKKSFTQNDIIFVFQDVGSSINPYLLSVVVGVIRMLVGLITSQLLYKFGRRPLCLLSLFFMAVLMFASGGCIFLVRTGK
jgi:hypothetical protein